MFAAVGVVLLAVEVVFLVRLVREPDDPPSGQVVREAAPMAPASLPRQGELVVSDVRADGDVAVTQWLRDDDPIAGLRLSLADGADGADGARAVGVKVVAADGVVLADALEVGREPMEVTVADPTSLVRVTYVLRGATQGSDTQPGRVLARPVAVAVDVPGLGGRTVVRVEASGRVLSLACADARSSVDLVRPCGAPDGDGWRVRLPREQRDDTVIAQVDVS